MDKLLDSEMIMIESVDTVSSSAQLQYNSESNPLARLSTIWRVAERVAVSVSLVVVLATIGYVSVYMFA